MEKTNRCISHRNAHIINNDFWNTIVYIHYTDVPVNDMPYTSLKSTKIVKSVEKILKMQQDITNKWKQLKISHFFEICCNMMRMIE
jgi:hypothetical protein